MTNKYFIAALLVCVTHGLVASDDSRFFDTNGLAIECWRLSNILTSNYKQIGFLCKTRSQEIKKSLRDNDKIKKISADIKLLRSSNSKIRTSLQTCKIKKGHLASIEKLINYDRRYVFCHPQTQQNKNIPLGMNWHIPVNEYAQFFYAPKAPCATDDETKQL